MYIFVLRLRNLIKLHGNVWATMYTAAGEAGSDGAGQRRLPSTSSGPGHRQSQPLPLRLRSRGNVPSSVLRVPPFPPEPTSPVPVSQGLASPQDCRTQGGARATWPRQAGSKLRPQIEAGRQHHCCPDFFSFWKLKLVRLFSFLCF